MVEVTVQTAPRTLTQEEQTFAAEAKVRGIRAEAERRLEAGKVLSSGVLFKCDDKSINRITALVHATFPCSFRTSAGVSVTINNQTEAIAVRDVMVNFAADVLAASNALQTSLPNDFTNDTYWP